MCFRTFKRKHVINLLALTMLTYYLSMLKFALDLEEISINDVSVLTLTNKENPNRCKIPAFEAMSAAARKEYKKLPPLNCQSKKPLTRLIGTTLVIDTSAAPLYDSPSSGTLECCFSYIYRKEQSIASYNSSADNQIEYGPCTPFKAAVKLTSDFVQVECSKDHQRVYLNAHAALTPRSLKPTAASYGPTRPKNGLRRPNVMIIGADSLSRLNFQRQMPRTYKLLEDLGFIQYFEYNKVADNTHPNLMASFTGRFPKELGCCQGGSLAMDDAPLIFKDFQQQQYLTFYGEDSPTPATFSYYSAGFVAPPTDYYYKPFAQAFRNLPRFNDGYCFGSQTEVEPLLDYTFDFMYQHQKRPYFGVSWGSQLTHNAFNEAQYADPVYYNFFEKLNATQILNDTVIFFVSDHGLRVGEFRESYQGRFEDRLPAFFARFPSWFKQRYPQAVANFRTNAYRLTSNFDFYQTLRSLVNVGQLTDSSLANIASVDGLRGQSLFKEVGYTRSCPQAGISDHWCTCSSSNPLKPDSPEALEVSVVVLNYLNEMLSTVPQCSTLSIGEIVDVELDILYKGQLVDMLYVMRVVTSPGNALLETTARYDNTLKKYRIVDEVSRLNMYRNQSWCVDDPILKLVCYCKVQNESI